MSKMTELETLVYESIKKECFHEYCSDVSIVSSDTGLSKDVVKGVIGSLTKKGMVDVEEDEFNGVWKHSVFAIVDGELWSYACEEGYGE